MSFELPLSALAMEIAGAAARAAGACNTLTLPLAAAADTDELVMAAVDVSRERLEQASFAVTLEIPPAITVTF